VLDHLQGAAAVGGTVLVRVVVGRQRAQGVGQLAVLLEVAQRLAAALDEGVDQLGVVAGADGLLQVGAYRLGRVGDAGGARLVAAGDPHGAAGDRRGAAEGARLLDDQHAQAAAGGGGGGGEAGRAAAEHHQVVFVDGSAGGDG